MYLRSQREWRDIYKRTAVVNQQVVPTSRPGEIYIRKVRFVSLRGPIEANLHIRRDYIGGTSVECFIEWRVHFLWEKRGFFLWW